MREPITRAAALAALRKYNHEPFHIQHALTVEGVMRWYAQQLGYGNEADFWATVGLLHDIDFEQWPEQHCQKAPELVRVAIQNFLKNPVISMVFGHPNRKISCISPHIRATVLRQPPFFTPKI